MIDIITGGKGSKNNNPIVGVFTIAITICIIILILKIYKSMASGTRVVGQQLGDQVISVQTGIAAARLAFIRSKAQDLWDNGTTNWGFTYDYNEEQFIQAINVMTSTKELSFLNDCFKGIHKKGLSIKNVLVEAFDNNDKARLKPGYYEYLLST